MNVGTMEMYFRPLVKEKYDKKYVVFCPFAGIGADIVALERIKVPVKAVITLELCQEKRKVLQNFLTAKSNDVNSSFYGAKHLSWGDITDENGVWHDAKGFEVLIDRFA